MNISAEILTLPARGKLLSSLREQFHTLSEAARMDDLSEQFPHAAMGVLRTAGCLRAVLPRARRGVGLGWCNESVGLLFDLLRAIGGVHLSCARLFEGHVNAFQLLWASGTPEQRTAVGDYVEQGGLLGVWNAPSPQGELVLSGSGDAFVLTGYKAYASGAGGIRRPLVTARHAEQGLVIVWPEHDYAVGAAEQWQMHGMRATMTRSVRFDGPVHRNDIFGRAEDYHAQPQFSGGSWRFLAAQLGAGEAIVEMMRQELVTRHRTKDSHQRARMAQCVTRLETCRKWVRDAAALLVDPAAATVQVIQHANGARVVVEQALLEVIEMVQRSVGLQLFSRAHPCERAIRDLATYLRQPAPDALLEYLGEFAFDTAQQGLLGGLYDEES